MWRARLPREPHGALYNQARRTRRSRRAIAAGVRLCTEDVVRGLAGSVMLNSFRRRDFLGGGGISNSAYEKMEACGRGNSGRFAWMRQRRRGTGVANCGGAGRVVTREGLWYR